MVWNIIVWHNYPITTITLIVELNFFKTSSHDGTFKRFAHRHEAAHDRPQQPCFIDYIVKYNQNNLSSKDTIDYVKTLLKYR